MLHNGSRKDRDNEQEKRITLHRGGGRLLTAFTMAEILLSLTIIGVVAAITLPSLTGNINERTWNTQRKALYARISQAIALMPALNGYGVDNPDTAAETFVTSGLSKVLKINNICDYEHLLDCGIPDKLITQAGDTITPFPDRLTALNAMFNGSYINSVNSAVYRYSQLDTKAAAFETVNGESIVTYYNPNCVSEEQKSVVYAQPMMCANFVYDLNGSKGPNTVGKDIGFITVLYPSDSVVVAPIPLTIDAGTANSYEAGALCLSQDKNSRVPNIEELYSLFYNKNLLKTFPNNSSLISGTLYSDGSSIRVRYVGMSPGDVNTFPRTQAKTVRCIKR